MREFIACTKGFPATWNDKTTVLYDSLARGIYDGEILPDYEFELLEYNIDGNIAPRKYKGVWTICDNGYLNWSTTKSLLSKKAHHLNILYFQNGWRV